MVWSVLLVAVALLVSILTNIVSNWIEPKLQNAKPLTIASLLLTAFLSGLYLDKKDVPPPSVFKGLEPQSKYSDHPPVIKKKVDPNIIKDQDSNVYHTFRFKNKLWLSKNLNMKIDGSNCYDSDDANCKLFGRFYAYESAIKACKKLGEGWRLPTTLDIKELLLNNNGGYRVTNMLGVTLETSGEPVQGEKNMTDTKNSGFRAVAGGTMYKHNFYGIIFFQSLQLGNVGEYWLAPSFGDSQLPHIYRIKESTISPGPIDIPLSTMTYMCSCRCVKDPD